MIERRTLLWLGLLGATYLLSASSVRVHCAPLPTDLLEEPVVRILLTEGNYRLEVISSGGPLRIEWRGASGNPGGAATVPSPLQIIAGDQRLQVGDRTFDAPVRIRSLDGEMQIGDRYHDGWIVWSPDKEAGGWRMIEWVPMERYLLGVVSREMSASSFPAAALEAQAIAARSYATFQIQARGPSRAYHLRGDPRSQAYGGTARIPQEIKDAVERTRGSILFTDGLLFESFYHSTCGGQTCSAADGFGIGEIRSMPSVPCVGCKNSRFYRWSTDVAANKLRDALEDVCDGMGIRIGEIEKMTVVQPTASGYVSYLRVDHRHGSFEVDVSRLRSALGRQGIHGLRSPSFEVQSLGDAFRFSGRGWGHGVGMCQVGAKGFAKMGANRTWILEHYYPGVQIRREW